MSFRGTVMNLCLLSQPSDACRTWRHCLAPLSDGRKYDSTLRYEDFARHNEEFTCICWETRICGEFVNACRIARVE